MSCRKCGTGCFGPICAKCKGEDLGDVAKNYKRLHEAIRDFRKDHMHLSEGDVIESLNEEMPNWDKVISDKFILVCQNLGVIEPCGDYGVKNVEGNHYVRVGTTYIDWASKRRFPSTPWPKVWEMDGID